MTDENTKVRAIRKKIDASQERQRAPRGSSDEGPRNDLRKIVDDHPLAALAGSIMVGVIASALLPASITRKLGRGAVALTAAAAEMGALYGSKALELGEDARRASADALGEFSDTLAETGGEARRKAFDFAGEARRLAFEFGNEASRRAAELAETASQTARDAQSEAGKQIQKMSTRIKR